jgi:dipeptidyl aminopeptidase/acylaminoacyl peptidase
MNTRARWSQSILSACFALSCAIVVAQSAPLEVEDALGTLSMANRMPIAMSPDGQWVAFTVEDDRRREGTQSERYMFYTKTGAFTEAVGCDVWIVNTKTGESRNLTRGQGTSSSPVWSPDGKYLAFYSDRSGTEHIWLWGRENGQMRQLSDAIPRPFFNFQVVRWTPDGRHVLAKVLPEGMTVEVAADLITPPAVEPKEQDRYGGATVTVYSSPSAQKNRPGAQTEKPLETQSWMERYRGDLALIDVNTGKTDRLVTAAKPLGYWISPNGKYLAYTIWSGIEENSQQPIYQLGVLSLANRKSRVVVAKIKQDYGISVSWSPNSSLLAYTTSENGDCYVVPVEGGAPKNLTPGTHPPFTDEHRAPLWDANNEFIYLLSSEQYGRVGSNKIWAASVVGGSLKEIAEVPGHSVLEIMAPADGGRFWSPDGHSMIVLARNEATKEAGFYRVPLGGGSPSPIFEEPRYFSRDSIFTTDVSGDGKLVAYVAQDSQHPEDVWVAGADFSDRRKLTQINPQIANVPFGKSRLIDWRSVDGQQLHGALLLPSNFEEGKRYPLIVDVYGGSFRSSTTYRFGLSGAGVENLQILATRGYAVLLPDTPLRKGTPMQDLLKTVMPGVDRVIDLGIADPDRLGVMGHSYGGYSTLSLIVQTTRFRAAVDSAGPADLISFYGDLDKSGAAGGIGWSETGQGGMVGTPWQFRDRYIENSPLFYLDRVETPLLIVQGDMDPIWKQADEVFVALRRLDKEVMYAKYHGEEHWEGTWSLANVQDYWSRVIEWFNSHLAHDEHS